MESRFDTSSPYNREIVLRNKESLSASSVIATANNSTADISVIDAMLSVLSTPPTATTTAPSSPGKVKDETIDDTDNLPPSAGINESLFE